VENPDGTSRGIAHADLDGVALAGADARMPLVDDGKTHRVHVVLGDRVRGPVPGLVRPIGMAGATPPS
jgi:hypothetical protein